MRRVIGALITAVLIVALLQVVAHHLVLGQIPITVYGYIRLPDGSPAAGAAVKVYADGVSASTTADSSGYYKVDLSVSSVPVTVTVEARLGNYAGKKTVPGVEGAVRIDVTLQKEKVATSISLSVAKTEYGINETVTLTGKLSPAMVAIVFVHVIDPNGEKHTYQVTTANDGSFQVQFKATIPGEWSAYAEYPGSDEYKSSKSNLVKFYVKQPLSAEVKVEVKEGKITVQCTTDKEVTTKADIYISLDNGTTWIPVGEATLLNGELSTTLGNLTVYGLVLIKVYLYGTPEYAACEVVTKTYIPSTREKQLESKIGELQARIEELENQIQKLTEELNVATQKYEQVKQELSKAISEKQQLETKVSQLSTERSTLSEKVSKLSAEINALSMQRFIFAAVSFVVGLVLGLAVARARKPK